MTGYLKDHEERATDRIDDLVYEFNRLNRDCPPGKFVCPDCLQMRDGQPIQTGKRDDSPVCCYECLDPESREMWDRAWNDSKENCSDSR